jgi:hypothetical protein
MPLAQLRVKAITAHLRHLKRIMQSERLPTAEGLAIPISLVIAFRFRDHLNSKNSLTWQDRTSLRPA